MPSPAPAWILMICFRTEDNPDGDFDDEDEDDDENQEDDEEDEDPDEEDDDVETWQVSLAE